MSTCLPTPRLVSVCSTPFGIYEVGTALVKIIGQYETTCSTPFGIYEVGTFVVSIANTETTKCSTPFGIYEVGTLAWRQAHFIE